MSAQTMGGVIGRCSKCRWWKPFAPKIRWGLGDCELFETHLFEKCYPKAKLEATGTESGEAKITTAHDFGCVQWARQPEV